MPHGSDTAHVNSTGEQGSEGTAPGWAIELAPHVHVLLDQRGPGVRTGIGSAAVVGIDSVGADGDNDIAVTGQLAPGVVITTITLDGRLPGGAGPRERAGASVVAAVQEDNQGIRPVGQVSRIKDRCPDFDCSG